MFNNKKNSIGEADWCVTAFVLSFYYSRQKFSMPSVRKVLKCLCRIISSLVSWCKLKITEIS